MSLTIDIDKVCDVLLADGWHHVVFEKDKSTFAIDAYEFIEPKEGRDPNIVVSGGSVQSVTSTGARWLERESGKTYEVTCPLTAILAVKRFIPSRKS